VVEGPPTEIVDEALVAKVFGLDAQVVGDPVAGTPITVPIGRHHSGGRPVSGDGRSGG